MWRSTQVWTARTGYTVTLVSANDHVHSTGSLHYSDRAIDVHGEGLDELAEFYRGIGAAVYWRVPGHWDHVHAELP